jgi:hypothetical protein
MTIAVAATFLSPEGRSGFLLAADARASRDEEHADTGIKTFALDSRVGAIESGDALSSATAIEMTRAVIADHNTIQPTTPFTFFNTVRVFSFFFDRIVQGRWHDSSSEVILAGFLQNGRPALASVKANHGDRTRVHLYSHVQPGSLIALTGQNEAKEQILLALRRAYDEDETSWPDRTASAIWYLSCHEGMPAIGGGVALAICRGAGCVTWPLISIAGRVFLRGLDVTDCYRDDTEKKPIVLEYDETWHALADAEQQLPKKRGNEGFHPMFKYVDEWVPPTEAFKLHYDPSELRQELLDPATRATVAIASMSSAHRAAAGYPEPDAPDEERG